MRERFSKARGFAAALREFLSPAWAAIHRFSEAFGEALIGWSRDGRLEAAAVASLLFIALAVAGIEADDYLLSAMTGVQEASTGAIWTKWTPLLLAFIVLALGMTRGGPWLHQPRILGAALVLAGFIGLRLWVAFDLPLTEFGLRETTDLYFAGLAGLALWVSARRYPSLTYLVWTLSLLIILLSRIPLWKIHFIFTPDLLPVTISMFWSFVVLGGLGAKGLSRDARREPVGRSYLLQRGPLRLRFQIPPFLRTLLPAHIAAFAIGLLLALICLSYTRRHSGSIAAGGATTGNLSGLLWARSVLLGWGRAPLLRLIHVTAAPARVGLPIWMGFSGFLASYGAAGLLALAFGSIAVLRLSLGRMRENGLTLTSGPQMALFAVQGLIALIVFGGPNSSIPPVLLAGWLGLAFAGASVAQARTSATGPSFETKLRTLRYVNAFCSAVVLLTALTGVALAFPPVLSRSILASVNKRPLSDPNARFKIFRAMNLDPWSPRAEMALAAWRREQLTHSGAWDENLYRQICDSYKRAMSLDPYDPVIALRLADVQLTAKRVDDALTTALKSLETNPESPELISWIYVAASSNDRANIAGRAISENLSISPGSARWWRARYRIDQLAGRGSQASLALGAALTSAVGKGERDEAELVKASYDRWQVAEQASEKAASP